MNKQITSNNSEQSIVTDNFFIIKSFGDSWVVKSIQQSENWYGDGHYREFVEGSLDNALNRARELSEILYGIN